MKFLLLASTLLVSSLSWAALKVINQSGHDISVLPACVDGQSGYAFTIDGKPVLPQLGLRPMRIRFVKGNWCPSAPAHEVIEAKIEHRDDFFSLCIDLDEGRGKEFYEAIEHPHD